MPFTRHKTRRLCCEFAPVSPPLSGRPRFVHFFAPPGSGLLMDISSYLNWRRSNYPFYPPRKHMQGDVDPEREANEVTSLNFWGAVIPRSHGRMDRINERLCAQLLRFAMCYVEVAAEQIARHLRVPLATPQEIFAGLLDIGLAQGPVLGHDIWRYAKCVEHPLIGAAVFNAVHHLWGAPHNPRAEPYPPPEDPFVTVRLPDEPPRVAVPLPRQCDATGHQHRQFPPGEGWPYRPGPRRKEPAPAVPNPPVSAPSPATLAEDGPATGEPPPPPSITLPPDEDELVAPVDPARFLDAAQAAFALEATYHNPHSEVLLALVERLAEPVSTGLPDPFAPALRVLVNTLYGPSRAYWDEASRVFRRRYLAAGDGRTVEAAVQRWRALLSLGEEARAALHEWCLSGATDHRPHRACALVTAGATVCLQRLRPPATGIVGKACRVGSFLAEAMLGGDRTGANQPAPAAEAIWKGFFDQRLFFSSRALSPLAQHFLVYLTQLIGAKGAAPLPIHKVWADDLAEHFGLDLHAVRAAFTHTDPLRSPAHELFAHRVVLADWRWGDFAHEPLELPWLDAAPGQGQDDGCAWQEVTLTRALLPCLRRLRLYLDGLPLVPAAGDS